LPVNSSPTSNLLGHRLDPLGESLAQLPIGGVDEHLTLVVDVDLGLELLLEGANGLAALADHDADLLRVDLHRHDARRVGRQLAARRVDHVGHLAEDELAGLVRLRGGRRAGCRR